MQLTAADTRCCLSATISTSLISTSYPTRTTATIKYSNPNSCPTLMSLCGLRQVLGAMLRRGQKKSQADQEETGLRAWSHPMGWKVQEVGRSEATLQRSKLGR